MAKPGTGSRRVTNSLSLVDDELKPLSLLPEDDEEEEEEVLEAGEDAGDEDAILVN